MVLPKEKFPVSKANDRAKAGRAAHRHEPVFRIHQLTGRFFRQSESFADNFGESVRRPGIIGNRKKTKMQKLTAAAVQSAHT